MKFTSIVLILAGLLTALAISHAAEDPRVTTAKAVLAAYQAGAPRNARVLHVAYFCPADQTPAQEYRDRLGRILKDISQFYATQVRQYGLPCDGFPLAKDANGELVIHLVKGSKPATEYSEAKSAHEIHEDVERVLKPAGIGSATNHVVVFTRLGHYDGTNTWHNSPYCGFGDAGRGFCWQFDSDILDTRLLSNTNRWVNDRQYHRCNFGRYNSIFIGGTAHELGHLFGLPHNDTPNADLQARGHNLMGDGNRHYGEERRGAGKGAFITLVDALRIVSNPVFSHIDKGLAEKWQHSITNCSVDASVPGRLVMTGQYRSNQPIYGVVAYATPNVDDDHQAVGYAGSLGPNNTFSIKLDRLPRPKTTADIRIILLCASGQHLSAYAGERAPFRRRYTLSEDGKVNLITTGN